MRCLSLRCITPLHWVAIPCVSIQHSVLRLKDLNVYNNLLGHFNPRRLDPARYLELNGVSSQVTSRYVAEEWIPTKFLAFYETRTFSTVFKTAGYWPLTYTAQIPYTTFHPIRCILISFSNLHLVIPSGPFMFSYQNNKCIFFSSMHATCVFHLNPLI
jgi:hypothetical protein